MPQQTAVEWLVEQIKSDQTQKALSATEWMQVIEQAKRMEKKQMRDIYLEHVLRPFRFDFEQYYNETYGK